MACGNEKTILLQTLLERLLRVLQKYARLPEIVAAFRNEGLTIKTSYSCIKLSIPRTEEKTGK